MAEIPTGIIVIGYTDVARRNVGLGSFHCWSRGRVWWPEGCISVTCCSASYQKEFIKQLLSSWKQPKFR